MLHTYQLLRAHGIEVNRIILILADDLAQSGSNPLQGVVRNEPGGENLYQNPVVDYQLSEMNSNWLAQILTGTKSTQTPSVLESTGVDDLLMFTCGHGTPYGIVLDGDGGTALTPGFWKSVIDSMATHHRFRRLFWAVESCYSGAIGQVISTPGILLMTAANPYETSKADQYDPALKSWLADRFSFYFNSSVATTPDITLDQLYEKSYLYVNGSHVSFYNTENFGNIYDLRLTDFIFP